MDRNPCVCACLHVVSFLLGGWWRVGGIRGSYVIMCMHSCKSFHRFVCILHVYVRVFIVYSACCCLLLLSNCFVFFLFNPFN